MSCTQRTYTGSHDVCACVCCCNLQGVVKALFEHRMLPRVLAGSSVGSIVAGLVATRTDDELRETFRCAC